VYFASVLLDGVDIGKLSAKHAKSCTVDKRYSASDPSDPAGGSPFKLTVDPGPAHANGCSAFGPGVDGGYVGVETSFTIQSRDYFGNTRTSGGDVFSVEIGGTASAEMRMRDNENGTYTVALDGTHHSKSRGGAVIDDVQSPLQVAFTPMVGGDYFISVTIQGTHIQGSPFTVTADPMPRESYLEVYRQVSHWKRSI
jgi:hypothetical protein